MNLSIKRRSGLYAFKQNISCSPFGKKNTSLTELQHLEIFKQIHLQVADSCSYPAFLDRLTDL